MSIFNFFSKTKRQEAQLRETIKRNEAAMKASQEALERKATYHASLAESFSTFIGEAALGAVAGLAEHMQKSASQTNSTTSTRAQ